MFGQREAANVVTNKATNLQMLLYLVRQRPVTNDDTRRIVNQAPLFQHQAGGNNGNGDQFLNKQTLLADKMRQGGK